MNAHSKRFRLGGVALRCLVGLVLAASVVEVAIADELRDGRTAFARRQWEEAEGHFRAALEAANTPEAQVWLGMTLAEMTRCDEALEHLAAASGKLSRRSDERKRAEAEESCRLVAAGDLLGAGKCEEAGGGIEALKQEARGRTKRAVEELEAARDLCLRSFGKGDDAKAAFGAYFRASQRIAAGDLDGAEAEVRASEAAKTNAHAHALIGMALAGKRDCAGAWSHLKLAASIPGLDLEDLKDVNRELVKCDTSLAKGHLRARDCARALPHLVSMRGKVRGGSERWRERKEKNCVDEAAPFPIEDESARAAWLTLLEADDEYARGRYADAVELGTRALAAVDAPSVRRALARYQAKAGSCAGMVEAAGGRQGLIEDPAVARALKACEQFPILRDGKGADLVRYGDLVEKGLTAESADAVVAALGQALDVARNAELSARYANALWEVGDCETYLREVGRPGIALDSVEKRKTRSARCKARLAGEAEPTGDLDAVAEPAAAAEPEVPPAFAPPAGAEEENDTSWVWGAVTAGVGVGLLGGGIYYATRWADSSGKVDDSEAVLAKARADGEDPANIAYLEGVVDTRRSNNTKNMGLTLGLGIGGLAVAGVGGWLLWEALGDGGDTAGRPRLVPIVGPGGVGLAGSF